MRKQIPTPIIVENGFVKCAECGKYIRFPLIDKYSYCPECGRAIDWEE
jgi:RNA polymerase-binding transcription factor DksA